MSRNRSEVFKSPHEPTHRSNQGTVAQQLLEEHERAKADRRAKAEARRKAELDERKEGGWMQKLSSERLTLGSHPAISDPLEPANPSDRTTFHRAKSAHYRRDDTPHLPAPFDLREPLVRGDELRVLPGAEERRVASLRLERPRVLKEGHEVEAAERMERERRRRSFGARGAR